MYTSSYTLYASRGSKCAPSCFDFPGLLNIESYGPTPFRVHDITHRSLNYDRKGHDVKRVLNKINYTIISNK